MFKVNKRMYELLIEWAREQERYKENYDFDEDDLNEIIEYGCNNQTWHYFVQLKQLQYDLNEIIEYEGKIVAELNREKHRWYDIVEVVKEFVVNGEQFYIVYNTYETHDEMMQKSDIDYDMDPSLCEKVDVIGYKYRRIE